MNRNALVFATALATTLLPVIAQETALRPAPAVTGTSKAHCIVDQVPLTPFGAPKGTWTLVALPDTQFYSQSYPNVYIRQTEWIVKNREAHNVRFVVHEGDITDDHSPRQWEVAQKAMHILNEGKVPYSLAVGNHDLGTQRGGGTTDRSTLLNDFFKPSDYSASAASGLFEPGHLENSWHEFLAPTGKQLVVSLEFGPRDAVLDWANEVIASHKDSAAIVVTHAYLYSDNTRYQLASKTKQSHNPKSLPFAKSGSVNDGEDMWNKLIGRHPNIQLVLCGHVAGIGAGYQASTGKNGNTVHQILADYQEPASKHPELGLRGYGGGGFLRLMQFLPDGKTVRIKTFSPLYDQWLTTPEQQFEVQLR